MPVVWVEGFAQVLPSLKCVIDGLFTKDAFRLHPANSRWSSAGSEVTHLRKCLQVWSVPTFLEVYKQALVLIFCLKLVLESQRCGICCVWGTRSVLVYRHFLESLMFVGTWWILSELWNFSKNTVCINTSGTFAKGKLGSLSNPADNMWWSDVL